MLNKIETLRLFYLPSMIPYINYGWCENNLKVSRVILKILTNEFLFPYASTPEHHIFKNSVSTPTLLIRGEIQKNVKHPMYRN